MFADGSKALLLLWILFVIYVSFLPLLCCRVWSLQSCGHLLERADLFALLCVVFSCVFFYHFPSCCSGSGMVLDCIDS